jgi:GNAT superfamily N-acetyltransferase
MGVIKALTPTTPEIEPLIAEAAGEGYQFLDRLLSEWESGANRFDQPGEMLCGYWEDGVLVAVGGLNRDPFAGEPSAGRIRRIYVRPARRNCGVGAALVQHLVENARKTFRLLYLRSESADAARLYERLGFRPCTLPFATHVLQLNPSTSARS